MMKRRAALAFVALFTTTSVVSAESVPLRPGYYVQRDTPCERASNATITLYDGVSFGAAHVECRKPVIRKLVEGSYQFVQQCRDMQGRGETWEAFRSTYSIQTPTEFTETTSFGTFSFRYCNRSDLPDPWKTNDLTSYGIK